MGDSISLGTTPAWGRSPVFPAAPASAGADPAAAFLQAMFMDQVVSGTGPALGLPELRRRYDAGLLDLTAEVPVDPALQSFSRQFLQGLYGSEGRIDPSALSRRIRSQADPSAPAEEGSEEALEAQFLRFAARLFGLDKDPSKSISALDVQLLVAILTMLTDPYGTGGRPAPMLGPYTQGSAPYVGATGQPQASPYAPTTGSQWGAPANAAGTAAPMARADGSEDGVTHIRQTANNCGPCALTMAMQSLGIDIGGVAGARARMGVRADGWTSKMSQVTRAAQASGATAREFRGPGGGPVTPAAVRQAFASSGGRDAAVVLSGTEYGGHLIAITGIDAQGNFLVRDSMKGGLLKWTDAQLSAFIRTKPDAAVAIYGKSR